ncbi:unnamed protein product [Orchesella dallaii]|uniref:Uncharacterized protein n=1 Tax=Orchesella dallaii TaxID=48710 RepID=A0ABP1QY99_9HEXA
MGFCFADSDGPFFETFSPKPKIVFFRNFNAPNRNHNINIRLKSSSRTSIRYMWVPNSGACKIPITQ